MERSVIRTVLANTELSSEEKLEQIMALSGADVMREKENTELIKTELAQARERLDELSDYDEIKNSLEEERAKTLDTKDVDALVAERDALIAQRNEELLERRFDAASRDLCFVNEFTRDGVKALFKQALADTQNAECDDSKIMDNIMRGHEREYLRPSFSIRMAPHSPDAGAVNDTDIIASTKYKGNPWLADASART